MPLGHDNAIIYGGTDLKISGATSPGEATAFSVNRRLAKASAKPGRSEGRGSRYVVDSCQVTIPKRPAGDFDGSKSGSDFSLTPGSSPGQALTLSCWERGWGIVANVAQARNLLKDLK